MRPQASRLSSCLQPLGGLPCGDDRDACKAAHRQEVALVARGDQIGPPGRGRGNDVIVIGIGVRGAEGQVLLVASILSSTSRAVTMAMP